jgi:hypothetical protein
VSIKHITVPGVTPVNVILQLSAGLVKLQVQNELCSELFCLPLDRGKQKIFLWIYAKKFYEFTQKKFFTVLCLKTGKVGIYYI